MKKILILVIALLVVGCDSEVKSNLLRNVPAKQQEQISVDVFSLTYHKQLGNCDSLPISHRMISFNPIYLENDVDDTFIGSIDVLLDEANGSYKARYREFPGLMNPDQTVYEDLLAGTFELVKAANASSNDKVILENIGTITPTISGTTINFFLKFDQDLNRVMKNTESKGRVVYSATPFITDNCLL